MAKTNEPAAANTPVLVDDSNMAPTLEVLQNIIFEKDAKIAELEATIAAQTDLITELTEKIGAVKKGDKVVVKLGKKKFRVKLSPGFVPVLGKHLEAEDIGDDSEELKVLVKIGAACLEEI